MAKFSSHLQPVTAENAAEIARRNLQTSGGGGTSDGMEPWQAAINRLEDKVDSHLKWLLIAFASGFVLVSGLVINRTDALGDRLGAKIDAGATRIDGRMDALTAQVSLTNERLARVETKLDPSVKPTNP